jgi:hypothetical protein
MNARAPPSPPSPAATDDDDEGEQPMNGTTLFGEPDPARHDDLARRAATLWDPDLWDPERKTVEASTKHKDVDKWTKRRRAEAKRMVRENPGMVAAAEDAKTSIRESVAGRQMYGSDPFSCHLETELEAALEREAIRQRFRWWWADVEYLARADGFDAAAERVHLERVCPGKTQPTRRVESPNGKPAGKRRRRTTVDLRDSVLALRDRGLIGAAIADTLNISDRRVTEILTRYQTSQNGARNPSVQAKLFAD